MTDKLAALFADREPVMTVPDVAGLLGITKQAVYKWLDRQIIQGYKVGSTWFILRDELVETIRSGANITIALGEGTLESEDKGS